MEWIGRGRYRLFESCTLCTRGAKPSTSEPKEGESSKIQRTWSIAVETGKSTRFDWIAFRAIPAVAAVRFDWLDEQQQVVTRAMIVL